MGILYEMGTLGTRPAAAGQPHRSVKWRSTAPYLGVLVPFCLLLVYASSLPLDRIFSVGGDDGFELSKAMLVERRPDLAVRMWNDQPWLYTVIQATLFR